jgi:hypothetical protein
VFGTIGADGRAHAHRSTPLPAARLRPISRRRLWQAARPEKSASKASPEDNISGRAVLWGRIRNGTVGIITAGIETGAAVAQGSAPRRRAALVAVAAAIPPMVEASSPFPPWMRARFAATAMSLEGRKPSARRGAKRCADFALQHWILSGDRGCLAHRRTSATAPTVLLSGSDCVEAAARAACSPRVSTATPEERDGPAARGSNQRDLARSLMLSASSPRHLA